MSNDVFGNFASGAAGIWEAAKQGAQYLLDSIIDRISEIGGGVLMAPANYADSRRAAANAEGQSESAPSSQSQSVTPDAPAIAPVASQEAGQSTVITLPTAAFEAVQALHNNESMTFAYSQPSREILGTGAQHGVSVGADVSRSAGVSI